MASQQGTVPSADQLLMERIEAAGSGMGLSVTARYFPDRPAIYSPHGDRTFGEVNARANRYGRALRARGLKEEDSLGIMCANRPEFADTVYGGQRSGFRTVPINWHLTSEEVAYVLRDSEAKAFVADARFAEGAAAAARLVPEVTIRFAVAGEIDGFESYESALAEQDSNDLEDPVLGRHMLYTSGTTGRPKGVFRPGGFLGAAQMLQMYGPMLERYAFDAASDTNLTTGPLYHSAPLVFSLLVPFMAGVGTVLMDGWDPEETLRVIEQHRVTHTHMVPIMFHRLLALPEETRSRYDISSLKIVLHGAAPCPVHTKKALMDWFGPIVHEYYAATEGLGTFVTPEEWLERPGTVGKPEEDKVEIRDEDGEPLPPGEIGLVYIRSDEDLRFEYYKDPEKTSATYKGNFFTLGDMGYVDEEGYVYLADRTADLIISGGVNVYPAEVDAVLLEHPAVADVATVGIPNAEWGEEVRSVVLLKTDREPSSELEEELVEHTRANLAGFKCPRAIDFVDDLPRHDTGKIYRRLVREGYWTQDTKI
ncbi:MAG: AMP-binding protein [Actinomycetota bacterium]